MTFIIQVFYIVTLSINYHYITTTTSNMIVIDVVINLITITIVIIITAYNICSGMTHMRISVSWILV